MRDERAFLVERWALLREERPFLVERWTLVRDERTFLVERWALVREEGPFLVKRWTVVREERHVGGHGSRMPGVSRHRKAKEGGPGPTLRDPTPDSWRA